MRFIWTPFGSLTYKKLGNGVKIHMLFHGFGQNMKAFDSYLPLRKEDDTFLVFDIFFHGQSTWRNNSQKLTKEIWKEFLTLLLEKEKIEEFHLIGYSMGGKFCLVTYELFPSRVNSLTLMAPDGIKTGFWYNMATFPGILNRSFKHVIFYPNRFFKTIDLLHQLGLLQTSLVKFVKSQMQTRTKRAQIYFTWNIFKPMQPDLKMIILLLNDLKTPISLITGEFDQMVTSKNLETFASNIPHIEKLELPCGHNTLISKTADFFSTKENI